MTEWQNEETEGIKNLRKQFKELSKENKKLKAEQANWENQNRSTIITQALANRGLDARVAKFYPADLGTDEQSVDTWFNENKELFGSGRQIVEETSDRGSLSEQEQRGYEIMQAMAAYETSIQQDFESVINKIQYDPTNPQKATDELLAALQAQGVRISNG